MITSAWTWMGLVKLEANRSERFVRDKIERPEDTFSVAGEHVVRYAFRSPS